MQQKPSIHQKQKINKKNNFTKNMTHNNIFKSRIILTYNDAQLTKDYQNANYPTLVYSNKILTIIQLLMLIGSSLPFFITSKRIEEGDSNLFYAILVAKILFIILGIILSILSYLPKKRFKLHKGISIFLYISFFLITFEIKQIVNDYTQMDLSYFNFVYFFEFLFICFWHFLKLLEFRESFLINVFLLIISFIFVYCIPAKASSDYETLITIIIMNIGIIVSSYMITRQAKSAFYFFYQLKEKNKWYEEILNNLNTGFIQIENNKIKFINNTLITKIKVLQQFHNICKEENNSINIRYSKEILELILGNINSKNTFPFGESGNHNFSFGNINLNNNSNTYINKSVLVSSTSAESDKLQINNDLNLINNIHKPAKSEILQVKNHNIQQHEAKEDVSVINLFKKVFNFQKTEHFSYIGRGTISYDSQLDDIESNELVYEILARFENDNNFQIIFNDITRTKIYEQKSAEFKYKNLLLAKIAHEFKNPIICIMELAEEVLEKQKKNDFLTKKEMSLISTFSDYLLILIKDLDYFSNTQIKKEISLSKTKVNLNDLTLFCTQIANALLKKNQKQNCIKFIVKNLDNLHIKSIETDEIKIKQILINLISNAIKFTNLGTVTLEISLNEERNFIFSVTDTGKGISNTLKKNLFNPFSQYQNDHNNKYGAGLGLSISYDLAKKLGGGLNYTSQVDKGTKFWFTIKNTNKAKTLYSDKTISYKYQELKLNYPINYARFEQISLNNSLTKEELSPPNKIEINIILADDEELPKKANMRILNKIAKEKNINLNIIESRDGVETLNLIYEYYYKTNKKISAVISDESMQCINGIKCAEIIKFYFPEVNSIPYYLVTSYENISIDSKIINKVFSKPLRSADAEFILCTT